ncbi:MAG: hypothetical protein FJ095_09335 [Deltaproteobacteria bacterium]|nr:hypothetical protein [Deltaproteobacteria bacterium]
MKRSDSTTRLLSLPLALALAASTLGTGCALRTAPSGPREDERVCGGGEIECAEDVALGGPTLQTTDGAIDYVIHVGGVCSTSFTTGGGGKSSVGQPGQWPGFVSVDAPVSQQDSMATAVADLTEVLDAFCSGEGFCHLYGYSNGAAVISQALSVHDDDRWNVAWVFTTASNEGGSELAASGVSQVGEMVGMSCALAGAVGPSDHRPAWNHHDTGGAIFYGIGGYQEYWYTGSYPDFFAGGANDGAVGMHSSAGLAEPYHIPDDDPWMCFADEAYYSNHVPAFDCRGFDHDHRDMKLLGIELLGG